MIRRLLLRSALSAARLIICLAPARAQDAAQVLRVSVGYGTLKNTPTIMARLTPETRAEVERLEKLARTANTEGKYGDALKHMYHAMALLRGTEWTPLRALGSAVTVKLDWLMLDRGDLVVVRIGQLFSLDEKPSGKLAVSISLLHMKGDEMVRELKTANAIEPDFIANPFPAQVPMPEVETGNYRIAVQLKLASGDPIVKLTAVHIERGLAADFATAKSRAEMVKATLKERRQDSLLAVLPTAEYRVSQFERSLGRRSRQHRSAKLSCGVRLVRRTQMKKRRSGCE